MRQADITGLFYGIFGLLFLASMIYSAIVGIGGFVTSTVNEQVMPVVNLGVFGGAYNSEIDVAYRDLLFRAPADEERDRYRVFRSRGGTVEGINNALKATTEYERLHGPELIEAVFQKELGRSPDAEEQAYFESEFSNGASIADIRSSINSSPEYLRRQHPTSYDPVVRAYRDLLLRKPDSEGLTWYMGMMEKSYWTEEQVRADIMRSQEYRSLHSS